MRRRGFITFLGGALAAWPIAARAQKPGRYVAALEKAKRDYEKISHPSEAARSNYIMGLVRLREKVDGAKSDEWQAIEAEIKRHPAPNDPGSKAFFNLRVGRWESPRHDYLYRADGSWTMLPADEGTTHGTWRIEGNQSFETVATDPPLVLQYIIILITKNDFVFTDQTIVFHETRLKD